MMDLNEILADSPSESKETVKETKKKKSKETVVDEDVRISPRTGKPIDKKHAPKKKRTSNKKSPVIGMNGFNLEEGDNTKLLSVNMELFSLPNIDMEDESEVQQRLSDYFALYAKADLKPTVAGMAMALNGMSRQTLWAITHNAPTGSTGYKTALPRPVSDLIKRAYFLLENLWESYMNSGKINPVAGIFLGKNNYGYQDKNETILTPNTQQESYSPDDIKARYIESHDSRDSD